MEQIIAVHSFRGGTGKSNLIANLAARLTGQGKRIGIVDMDLHSPGIHALFRLNEGRVNRSLNDYLWGRCAIQEVAYDVTDTLTTTSNKSEKPRGTLFLVPSSIKAAEICQLLREGYDVIRLNDGFQELVRDLNLDYLFIDTGPGLNEETLVSISASQILVVVLRPDAQDFVGTSVTVHVASQLKVPKMFLVVNKALPSLNFAELRQQVESTYGVAVAGIIPMAEEMVQLASQGIFCLHYDQHPVTQTIYNIAERLTVKA